MLEKLPAGLGRALRRARHDPEDLVCGDPMLTDVESSLVLTSPAFEDGGPMPARYTADGNGVSPPLEWRGMPPETAAAVLLIEDADSPTPSPLVHAIVADLPERDGMLIEGALTDLIPGQPHPSMGRNSYLRAEYLPPAPPPGHGPHRYGFQLFALDTIPHFETPPGRGRLIEVLRQHAIAKGLLIGTYERR